MTYKRCKWCGKEKSLTKYPLHRKRKKRSDTCYQCLTQYIDSRKTKCMCLKMLQVKEAYNENFYNLIDSVGTPQHQHYLEIERKLDREDIRLKKILGITRKGDTFNVYTTGF